MEQHMLPIAIVGLLCKNWFWLRSTDQIHALGTLHYVKGTFSIFEKINVF